jgi:quercetin dioxygenase-like cupin family protein
MTDPTQVQFFSYDDADPLHPVAGIEMRAVFSDRASVNLVHLAPDAELPLHSHPHEQIGVVLEGVQVLIVGGREHQLGVNEAYVVPGGVEHGGRGGPDGCRVLDVFVPGREDYRSAAAPPRAASSSAPGSV